MITTFPIGKYENRHVSLGTNTQFRSYQSNCIEVYNMIFAYIEEETCIRVQLAVKKSLKTHKDDFVSKAKTKTMEEQTQILSSSILEHITLPMEQGEAGQIEGVEFPVVEATAPELDWPGLTMLEAALRKLQETAHIN